MGSQWVPSGSHGTEVWIDASVFSAATEATEAAPRDSSHCIAHRAGSPGTGDRGRVGPGRAQLLFILATAVTGGQNAIESHKGHKGPFLQKTRDCLEFVTEVVTSGRKMRYAAQWPHLKQKWLNLTVA